MADSKLADLTAITTPADDDLLYVVHDPAGTPVDRKVTVADLRGASGLTVISDQTLGAAAATIDFSSIPATYMELRLVFQGRSDRASTSDTLGLRINNDSAANYRVPALSGNGISASTATDFATGYIPVCEIPGASATAGTPGQAEIQLANYAGTTFHKTALILGGDTNGSTEQIRIAYGRWANTAAINRLTLIPVVGANFVAGTRATLYGIG